jgi:hypothetical protein
MDKWSCVYDALDGYHHHQCSSHHYDPRYPSRCSWIAFHRLAWPSYLHLVLGDERGNVDLVEPAGSAQIPKNSMKSKSRPIPKGKPISWHDAGAHHPFFHYYCHPPIHHHSNRLSQQRRP